MSGRMRMEGDQRFRTLTKPKQKSERGKIETRGMDQHKIKGNQLNVTSTAAMSTCLDRCPPMSMHTSQLRELECLVWTFDVCMVIPAPVIIVDEGGP